jgi:ribosome-binding factor A
MSNRDHRGSRKDGPRGLSQRQLRVGELVRHTLADIFARGEIRDPALMDTSITVTEVRMTPDLRLARAFVLPLGGKAAKEVLEALNRCVGFVRGRVSREVNLKFSPQLEFHIDDRFEYADKIHTLLHDSRVAKDLDPDPDQDPNRNSGEGGNG